MWIYDLFRLECAPKITPISFFQFRTAHVGTKPSLKKKKKKTGLGYSGWNSRSLHTETLLQISIRSGAACVWGEQQLWVKSDGRKCAGPLGSKHHLLRVQLAVITDGLTTLEILGNITNSLKHPIVTCCGPLAADSIYIYWMQPFFSIYFSIVKINAWNELLVVALFVSKPTTMKMSLCRYFLA